MFRILSAALALALVGSLAVPSPVPAAANTTVEVVITVLGPNGQPFVTTGVAGVDRVTVELQLLGVGVAAVVTIGPDGTGSAIVPAGSYLGRLVYQGAQNVLDQWSGGAAVRSQATVSTFTAGVPASMNFALQAGGVISGALTGVGFALTGAGFTIYSSTGAFITDAASVFDVESQSYIVTRLQPGTYYLQFSGQAVSGARLERRWIGNVLGPPEPFGIGAIASTQIGTAVALANGQTFAAEPITLNLQSVIAGIVEYEEPPASGLNLEVELWADGTLRGSQAVVLSGGRFVFRDVARYSGDEWSVCLAPRGDWYRTCWSLDGAARLADAGVITAQPNEQITDLVIEARRGGRMTIDVEYDLDGTGATTPEWPSGFQARVFRVEGDGPEAWRTAVHDDEVWFAPGYLNFARLTSAAMESGNYIVEIVDDVRPILGRTYLKTDGTTTAYLDEASVFTVARAQELQLSTVLRPLERSFDRISGADRFAGSVAISEQLHDDASNPVVYIANGLTFPDALAAGPAVAAESGSLLLVTTTSIPPVVAAELERLQPSKIVIVGGLGTVGAAVESQLRGYVDEPGRVERRSGVDRYETSRAVVDGVFGGTPGLPVFIATGGGYADALAAGAAAGVLGGPVVLVDGSRTSIDLATRTLLDKLRPSAIFIAGGPGSVSTSIEGTLRSAYGSLIDVYRLAGPDRYATAVAINQLFAESPLAFVASGEGFADALAGAPLAAAVGAPLYLTRPQCLPRNVSDDLRDLRVATAVIIGGTGVVRQSVEFGTIC